MRSVGISASGVRGGLAQRPLAERPMRRAHADTSWTSPAARSRVRPVTSRNTSSSVGSVARPQARCEIGLEVAGRALAHDQTVVDDREPIAELVGFLQVLRREEDRRPALVDAADLVPDRQPAGGVQPGRRLVEEEHLGLVHERRGKVEPALHAAGVALDAAVAASTRSTSSRSSSARSVASARVRPKGGPAGSAARGRSGAGRGRPPAGRRRCGAAPRQGRAATSTPATRAVPDGDRQQRREHAHRGRLACAVGAEKAEDLPRGPRGRPRGRPRPYRRFCSA